MQKQDMGESTDLQVEFSVIPPTRTLTTDTSLYLNDSWLLKDKGFLKVILLKRLCLSLRFV